MLDLLVDGLIVLTGSARWCASSTSPQAAGAAIDHDRAGGMAAVACSATVRRRERAAAEVRDAWVRAQVALGEAALR
jgi:hypothetical protein